MNNILIFFWKSQLHSLSGLICLRQQCRGLLFHPAAKTRLAPVPPGPFCTFGPSDASESCLLTHSLSLSLLYNVNTVRSETFTHYCLPVHKAMVGPQK